MSTLDFIVSWAATLVLSLCVLAALYWLLLVYPDMRARKKYGEDLINLWPPPRLVYPVAIILLGVVFILSRLFVVRVMGA